MKHKIYILLVIFLTDIFCFILTIFEFSGIDILGPKIYTKN